MAHTPKRSNHRPITVNDLQGSKVLSNFADNIFAIGDSRQDAAGRYIKQIKPRSTEMIYDATHVPSFKIARFGGNFLGFEYQSFEPESELLVDGLDRAEWELIEQIKKMSDSGRSVRAIAEELEMSKSAVHRKLHMWKPSKNAPSCSTHCCDTSPPPDRSIAFAAPNGASTKNAADAVSAAEGPGTGFARSPKTSKVMPTALTTAVSAVPEYTSTRKL